jgi:hypothetical protein
MALKLAGLLVKPLQCGEFFFASKLCLSDGRLQHVYCLVVDLKRNWKRVPVLAAMRQREPPRIAKPAGGSVHDLGDHGQRADGSRADAGGEQEFGKIRWPTRFTTARPGGAGRAPGASTPQYEHLSALAPSESRARARDRMAETRRAAR